MSKEKKTLNDSVKEILQAAENAGACGWKLSKQEWAEIDKISKTFYNTLPPYKKFTGIELEGQ